MLEPSAPLSPLRWMPLPIALFAACIELPSRVAGQREDRPDAQTSEARDDDTRDDVQQVVPLTHELCAEGYEREDGETGCLDIDECVATTSPCAAHATCVNTPGAFDCVCSPGYSGDGATCSPCGAATVAGLEVYFTFDADLGETVADLSGKGHDGVPSHLTTAPGKLGDGAAFDGAQSRIALESDTKVEHSRTICAWLKPQASLGLGQPIVVSRGRGHKAKDGESNDADRFGVSASAAGGSMCGSDASSSPYADTQNCVVAATPVAPDAWSFVCYAWTEPERSLRVYANGAVTSFADIDLVDTTLADMAIGSNPFGGSSTRASLAGTLDEVAIWTRALAPSEMDLLYNDGEGCRVR